MDTKIIIIGLSLISFFVDGQTIQGVDYPSIGTVNSLTLADTVGVTAGNSGDGVIWDFSTLSANGTYRVDSFMAPSSTPYGSSFPTATIVDRQTFPGTDYYIFFNDDGTELQRVGNVKAIGTSNDTVIYYDPANQFPYPISFGSSNNDPYFASYYSSGDLTHMNGTFNNTVDGRGTLKLPTGTYTNVIRMKFTRNELDTIYTTPIMTGTLKETFYYWYQTSSYYPLLYIQNTVVTFNALPNPIRKKFVGYRAGNISGLPLLSKENKNYKLYPNPVSTNLKVYNLDKNKILGFKIFSLDGNTIKKGCAQFNDHKYFTIDLSAVPNGIYFFQSDKGSVEKLVIQH